MRKSRYKDILAAVILLGVLGLIIGVAAFAKYASEQAKEYVGFAFVTIFALIFLGLIWKAIRLIID